MTSLSDSSLARLYISLILFNSFFDTLNNLINLSKCFFSLTIFFTLLLSFQKSFCATIKFKVSKLDSTLLTSKIPPDII